MDYQEEYLEVKNIKEITSEEPVYVYDIEVEDTHSFFANNILVHNSIYVSLEDFVEKITKGKSEDYTEEQLIDIVDAFCKKKLVPYIADSYEKMANHINSRKNQMKMKREVLATSAIWRAKKKYIMNVIDDEGVRFAHPKLKMMGVETAKGATPDFIRDALIECYSIMLAGTNDELIDKVKEVRDDFFSRDFRDYAFATGVNNIEKYIDKKLSSENKNVYIKGTPYHIKASIGFNNALLRLGLDDVKPIYSGDKIKIVTLKENNPFLEEALAFSDDIPAEFELEKYIDKESMFDKIFLTPLRSLSDLRNWSTDKIYTFDDLF